MSTDVITTSICDYCGEEIARNSKFLNAEVYGIDLHLDCLYKMSAVRLIVMLRLDELLVSEESTDDLRADAWLKARISSIDNMRAL